MVNGTIGKIISFSRALDTNDVDKVKIVLTTGLEYEIERVSVKFQIMDGIYVLRKQFPLCLSYSITIHKSQGLSLKNAVIDAGNSIFTCGQVDVALSRVTTLEGLHLINFDPHSVKADELAVIEYNRLKKKYRPDLALITFSKQRAPKVPDLIWAIPKNVQECQEPQAKRETSVWCINGLANVDGVSCYASAIIHCMFHCQPLRKGLTGRSKAEESALTLLLHAYVERSKLSNAFNVREYVGESFIEKKQHDASKFFMGILR